MTFDELRTTLEETLATGKIGTPVSVRLHLQFSDAQADLPRACAAAVQLTSAVFKDSPATLAARRDAQDRQWNVLLKHAGGQTALVTLGRGSAERARCHLLLVGNHGIVRLEGDEFDESSAQAEPQQVERWRKALETSFAQDAAVRL